MTHPNAILNLYTWLQCLKKSIRWSRTTDSPKSFMSVCSAKESKTGLERGNLWQDFWGQWTCNKDEPSRSTEFSCHSCTLLVFVFQDFFGILNTSDFHWQWGEWVCKITPWCRLMKNRYTPVHKVALHSFKVLTLACCTEEVTFMLFPCAFIM